MPKTLIRILVNTGKALWDNDYQREDLRNKLNIDGFYVITGENDSLEVYAIDYKEWYQ